MLIAKEAVEVKGYGSTVGPIDGISKKVKCYGIPSFATGSIKLVATQIRGEFPAHQFAETSRVTW